MKFDLILFDADGTLLEFEEAETKSFFQACNKLKIKCDLEQLRTKYQVVNSAIWKEFEDEKITAEKLREERFRRLFNQEQLSISPAEMSKEYLDYLSQKTNLLKNALAIVKYCSQKSKIALITNGLTDVQKLRIGQSPLKKYFKDIFISEEIGYPKPNPKIFYYVFKRIKVNPENTIIIGDNLNSDIKGGKEFGMKTCWFNPKNKKNVTAIQPDFEINELMELKKIIS